MYRVDVYHYNALSDGVKKVYTNADELKEYGNRGILDPNKVSYYSLFINGILQPKANYEIEEGRLTLKTEDVPLKDSTIILTFVTIAEKEEISSQFNSLRAEGMLPSGQIALGPVTDLNIAIDGLNDSNLQVEKNIVAGPKFVYIGQICQWEFTLRVSNTANEAINNIVVTDNILLDSIINIKNLSLSQGNIIIENGTITWGIDTLGPGDAATATFRLEGFFNAHGSRFVGRAFATATATAGPISSPIVHGEKVEVNKGIFITNTIISGPVQVRAGNINTWRVEIKISNLSNEAIADILVMNNLFIEKIHDIRLLNSSKGQVKLYKSRILWKIEKLKPQEISLLILDIKGAFNSKGLKNLSAALGVGNTPQGIIFSNVAKDFQIAVYPSSAKINKGLVLEKELVKEPLADFLNTFKKWTFSIKVTNTSRDFIRNINVTDYLLFDKLAYIKNISASSGTISIMDNSIIWHIDGLYPGESLVATFEVKGLFSTTGLRAANRTLATGFTFKRNSCILSNIACGQLINIFDPIKDLRKTCILVDKVFSQYQDRICIDNMAVYIGEEDFRKIVFKAGFIVPDSLKIYDLHNQPHFKRVRFILKVPFQIITTNNKTIDGYLPDILMDIVMYMPEARDEFTFDISVETSSKLLRPPIKEDNRLNFPVGVFIKVGAVGKVQLMVPAYEFTSYYSTLEKIEDASMYKLHILEDLFNYYLSHNEEKTNATLVNQCPHIFASLKVEKYIVRGPLMVSSDTANTLMVEIRVTNDGNGPVSHVAAIDTLFLNNLINLNIIGTSKGYVWEKENKIIWNIGTLNSNETAVLLAQVTGSFYNDSAYTLSVEHHQYNTVSDGESDVYTNYDELTEYGNLGIPDPDEVSFLNLYVNGVLQPKINYKVEQGVLTLLTDDVPIAGAPIILEYFKIKNKDGQLIKADVYQYNTMAQGKSIYTNDDELTEYGNQGILDPEQVSYINLFINGVIQPKVNYSVTEGSLELQAEPLPILGAPIILQFITFL